MITEDYVSFETAKLLKEKGFDSGEVGCHGGYYSESCYAPGYGVKTNSGQEVGIVYDDLRNCDLDYDECLRPTLQMAMKWLREVHKIGVFPSTYTNIIGSNTTHVYGTAIVNLNTYELMTNDCMGRDTFNEAVEAAIKYCLENLI